MKIKFPKEDEVKMVKFLRYRTADPAKTKLTYMALKDIAKFIGKSVQYVHKVCKELAKESKKTQDNFESLPLGKYRVIKGQHFTKEQEQYLTSQRTLDNWASKSIEQRVRLFVRRYPTTKTTTYKIRKLYKNHKIKKKVIRTCKVP